MKRINSDQIESEQLIERIEDAKVWLDKAKEYYQQANPTRGEITLNLAQAEVKHAWELSRERYVSNKQITIPKRKFNHLAAVAASILVFISLIFGYRQGDLNQYLAGIFKPIEKSVSVDSDSKLAATKITQNVLEVDISRGVQERSENSIEPVSLPVKNDDTLETQESSVIAGGSKQERSDSNNLQNTVRIRQASQFAIDEDALTREASRSLRNGK